MSGMFSDFDPEYFQRLLRDLSPRPGERVDLFLEERSELALAGDAEGEQAPRFVHDTGFAFQVAAPGGRIHRAGSPASEVRIRDVFRELAQEFGVEPFFRKVAKRQSHRASEEPGKEIEDLEEEARQIHRRLHALAARERFGIRAAHVSLSRRRRGILTRDAGWQSWIRGEVHVQLDIRRSGKGATIRAGAVRYDAGLDAYLRRAVSAALPDDPLRAFPSRTPVTAVFAEGTAATFFHETIGHLLEADALAEGLSPLLPVLGATVAPPTLTVWDDPDRPDLPGGIPVDDEGNPSERQALIDRGRVGIPLGDFGHSDFGPPGRARRATWADPPLPRVTNLVVSAGRADFDSVLRTVSRGILVTSLGSGSVDPASGRFSLRVLSGRWIRKGELGAPCPPTWIAGDLFQTLEMIRPEIGEDLAVDYASTICSRRGQSVPVGGLAPLVAVPGLVTGPGES